MASPPSLVELLVGPFRGFAIYPRAARTPALYTVGLLLVVIVVAGSVLAGQWYVVRADRLEDVRHSSLYLMPRVTIAGGVARTNGAIKLYDAVHFLVWVDTSTNSLEAGDVPMARDERRPLVQVGREALVVHRRDEAPQPLAWAALEERYGSFSLDGTEIADWLGEQLPSAALTRLMGGVVVASGWQVVLLLGMAFLYRVIFFRGLYVPGFGALVSVGAAAALPAVALATLIGLSGLGQPAMVIAHGAAVGILFLAAATRVRLSDDDEDRSSDAVAPREAD